MPSLLERIASYSHINCVRRQARATSHVVTFAFAFAFAFAFNAVDLDLPESSIPFSKSCQRRVGAPWMARKALPHRMCDQRVPVDDMILKIAAGNPQG